MKAMLIVLAFVGAFARADYEDIKYACMCGCYDYELRPVRVRTAGGGYGYEFMHMPLINPRTRYAEFKAYGVADAGTCGRLRGSACAGLRSYSDTQAVAGWTDRCRWSYDYGD